MFSRPESLYIILDNVRSALNVGSIIRTMDGAGLKNLVVLGVTPFPPHPKVLKTSLGAERNLEINHFKTNLEFIKWAKMHDIALVSIEESDRSLNYFQEVSKFYYAKKLGLIFGNEISGISQDILKESHSVLKLPMEGQKNSLNVSATAAIVIYNLVFKNEK